MHLDDDKRAGARQEFERLMRPLLELGERYQDASDVTVNGEAIWLHRGSRKSKLGFADLDGITPRMVQAAAKAAAVYAGTEFGPHAPLLSVKLPPDLRVTFVMPPAADRWQADVRFLRSRVVPLDGYVAQGVMTAAQLAEIRALVVGRKNILISGQTGAGKTTLLRAILSEIDHDERLVVIEDTPELNVPGDNVVPLSTTSTVDMAALVRHTLRLTPDRIVLGEVRGTEALELVTAMNTGHGGTLCTIHSNGARDALHRLHNLMRRTQPNALMEEIESAVDVVLQLAGLGEERRLAGIWRVPQREER